jgi:hypothetical protein
VLHAFRAPERRSRAWLPVWSTITALAALTRPDGLPLVGATATRLKDGRVLIAGGRSVANDDEALTANAVAGAYLLDPSTGQLSPTGSMTTARERHTATLLADGRVLIAGGWNEAGSTRRVVCRRPSSAPRDASISAICRRERPELQPWRLLPGPRSEAGIDGGGAAAIRPARPGPASGRRRGSADRRQVVQPLLEGPAVLIRGTVGRGGRRRRGARIGRHLPVNTPIPSGARLMLARFCFRVSGISALPVKTFSSCPGPCSRVEREAAMVSAGRCSSRGRILPLARASKTLRLQPGRRSPQW